MTSALALANRLGEADEGAWIEDLRAAVAWLRGDMEHAERHFQARVESHRMRGNRQGEAEALHQLGDTLRELGRPEEAEAALANADAIFRELGYELGFANTTHSLADLALDRGQIETAGRLYQQGLALDRHQGYRRNIAYSLAGIASTLAYSGHEQAAATIWGAICNAEETLALKMIEPERRRYETHLRRLEDTPAWTDGKQLTLDEAIALTSPPSEHS